ncbi:MAG: hemolysin family protein [Spirochaetaceae bacterium]|nr:hemolysin family protein [Spirochaetaceae bacterium]
MKEGSFWHALMQGWAALLNRKLKRTKKREGPINRRTYRSLETDQREMIRGVVELSGTTAKEVMVPRIDTVFLQADASQEDLVSCITQSGHSRFPVYEETIDNVIGILYVKDLLTGLLKNEPFELRKLLKKPFFVPESKHIDDLLRELRHRRVHIAVVVDEYGGVSGIVCMENIIEEIIGDIQDEFDHETEDVLVLGEGIYLCDARVNLEDLSEQIGLDFPTDDFDTLGGFVFNLFGKIPVRYEKTVYQGHDFIIQDMEGHKIKTIKLMVKPDFAKSDFSKRENAL